MTVTREEIDAGRLENLKARGNGNAARNRSPVLLVFPWTMLLPDNHRLTPVVRWGKDRWGKPAPRPAVITTGEYRDAKKAVAESAQLQFRGWRFTTPVSLVGRAWFPDQRKRDAGNYRKLLTDALTGILYEDDSLVHDDRWIRAGVDRTRPRIEVTIELFEEK